MIARTEVGASGMDMDDGFTRCRMCAFWLSHGETGYCHRNAPAAGGRALEVARWPETRAKDGCGEGLVTETPPYVAPEPRCGLCTFWRRPSNGIDPVSRGDHPMAWWFEAGVCRRYAPRPQAELGLRAFWRVTHRADFCFDGFKRQATRLGPDHAAPTDQDEPVASHR